MKKILEIAVFGVFKSFSDIQAFQTILEVLNRSEHVLEFRNKIYEYAQSKLDQNFSQKDLFQLLFQLRIQFNQQILEEFKTDLSLTKLGKEVFENQNPIFVITNSYEQSVQDYLSILDLNLDNIHIFGTESFNRLGLIGKPQAEVLTHFLQENQLENQKIIYIGDSNTDREFAKNCEISFELFDPKSEELKSELKNQETKFKLY